MTAEKIKIDTVFDDESLHVGQVYAKALLAAAGDVATIDQVVDELRAVVADVLNQQPGLDAVFSNPRIDVEAKVAMLDRIFGSRVSPTLINFLKVVARRRRLGMLRSIEKSVGVMRDAATGRLQVLLTTAEPLDADSMETIRTSLSMKFNAPVSVSNKVDSSILGGLVIRVGDVVYDGSVDGQLKNLRNSTVAKAEQAIRDRLGSLAT